MTKIINNISDANREGTINVYAVRYNQSDKAKNVAVALPGNLNSDLRDMFCNSIVEYKNAKEEVFNPLSDGVAINTYEYIPLTNVQDKSNELISLLNEALDYHGSNKSRVPFSNLFVCALDYDNNRYYLCAKQKNKSDTILKGKIVMFSNQDELMLSKQSDVFIMSSNVSFIIDESEKKVLVFDKKAFQDIFKYDDYQKEKVQKNIAIVDNWSFLASSELIKRKSTQKNVYRNLVKVFENQEYLKQIESSDSAQLKQNLLKMSPENFSDNDFSGDKLIVTEQNLEKVLKMLSKGFKYNFFANVVE